MIETSELRDKLATGRRLTAKLGIDTTAPVITLGHAVVLRRLAAFQLLGHRAVFLIGDETARVGDPSGRSDTRPSLTEEQVQEAAKAFLNQVRAILDLERIEVRYNSEWLRKLGFSGALELAGHYTVARMLEREDFAKRFRENRPIYLHEFLYPLMQGYDSVALQADVELGATEQKFNLLVGRQLQREHGQQPQVLLIMPILTGLDGQQKMSKSLGNYVAIDEPPDEMFGKLMSIPDRLIGEYLLLAAARSPSEVRECEARIAHGENPRDAKASMAEQTVALYYGAAAAQAARERFDRTFREHEVPQDAPSLVPSSLPDARLAAVLVQAGMATSTSAARRLIAEGAVRDGGEKLTDPELDLRARVGSTLRVGKHRFLRLEP